MNQLIGAQVLPSNTREKIAKAVEDHQILTIQLMTSKRDLTIEFTDGKTKTFEDIDLATQEGDFFTFFSKKENTLYKYPNYNINSIVQKMK